MQGVRQVQAASSSVASGNVSQPLDPLQVDGFECAHTVTGTRVRSSLMVDEKSYKTVIHRTATDGQGTRNTMHNGRPLPIR